MPRAAKPPAAKIPSPRNGPAKGLKNTSRGAGQAVPPSAAATAAFRIDPAVTPEENQAALRAHANTLGETLAQESFHQQVLRQSVPIDGGSADAMISPDRITDAEDSPPADIEADIARIRALRRPLGSFSQKLALNPIPGYHLHWFNDTGARIDEAKAKGDDRPGVREAFDKALAEQPK